MLVRMQIFHSCASLVDFRGVGNFVILDCGYEKEIIFWLIEMQ